MATGQLEKGRLRLPALPGVPVLLYHGFFGNGEVPPVQGKKYWLSVERFQAHLAAMWRSGTRLRLLGDPLDAPPASGPTSEAILTFDDGWEASYRLAFPLLQAASVRAEFFVCTALLDQPGYLRWGEVVEMSRAGMSFQSHGHDHVDLARLTPRARYNQLMRSKSLLEDRLGRPVTALAAPYGLLNRQLVEEARRVGYRVICSSHYWPAQRGAEVIGRATIYASTTARDLSRILAKDPLWYWRHRLRSSFIYLPRRLALSYWPAQFGVQTLQEQP